MGKTSSQDHCASSDSLHDEGYGKRGNDLKPASFLSNPSFSINVSRPEISQPMVQVPYAYADPFLGGIFTPYGPHMIPQVMGAASSRVALPVNLPEDGPIYVNAKQYHGILRRRQIRAKMEAQNKLVKMRKPYLHESRHAHALNRVRGSGGRFLSTKKLQRSSSCSPVQSQVSHHSLHLNPNEGILDKHVFRFNDQKHKAPSIAQDTSSASASTSTSTSAIFQHSAESRFSSISHHMLDSGGLAYGRNRHHVSIVR